MNNEMKIVLAEDELITALDIKQRLKKEFNAEVITTAKGKEIMPLALEYQPDIVVSDIKLKDEVSGIDAVKELKSKYNVPVIFITAYTMTFYMEQISKMPNVFVLPKPLNFKLFSSIIKSLMK
jgi:DNA-binding NarL/FixJ family response regulator